MGEPSERAKRLIACVNATSFSEGAVEHVESISRTKLDKITIAADKAAEEALAYIAALEGVERAARAMCMRAESVPEREAQWDALAAAVSALSAARGES